MSQLTLEVVARIAEEKAADALVWAKAELEARKDWKNGLNALAEAKIELELRNRDLAGGAKATQATSKIMVIYASNIVRHWEIVSQRAKETLVETEKAKVLAENDAAEWAGKRERLARSEADFRAK